MVERAHDLSEHSQELPLLLLDVGVREQPLERGVEREELLVEVEAAGSCPGLELPPALAHERLLLGSHAILRTGFG